MQRVAFTMRIKPGTEEEYRRRHQLVWPELLADLTRAGCENYSIYLRGTELFAYMEVADFQRSVILNQVENGIAVRMAVLEKVIG